MSVAEVCWFLPVGSTSLLPLPIHHWHRASSHQPRPFSPRGGHSARGRLYIQLKKLCALPHRGLPEGAGTQVGR